jgi:periplasmic protein TonB
MPIVNCPPGERTPLLSDASRQRTRNGRVPPAAFARFGNPVRVSRPWPAAFVTSALLCVALMIATMMVGRARKPLFSPPPEPLSLTFVERIPRPELPVTGLKEKTELPPSPKVPLIRRRAAPAAPAAIPENMKARKLDVRPVPKELVAPETMPQAPPKEAEPSADKGIGLYGEPGRGDPAGLEGGGGNSAGSLTGNVALPQGAIPPRPHKGNQPPRYPLSAMASHKVGKVLLRYIVHADGGVTNIEVLRGEEPFASEAITAVQRWRYDPAISNGRPISVSHVIELRFRFDR